MNPIDIETITANGTTTAIFGGATAHVGDSPRMFERNGVLVSLEGDGVLVEDLTEAERGFIVGIHNTAARALTAALLAHYGDDAAAWPVTDRAEHHDDQTLTRVHDVLAGLGFTEPTRLDAISAFQNAGILFRERGATGNATGPHTRFGAPIDAEHVNVGRVPEVVRDVESMARIICEAHQGEGCLPWDQETDAWRQTYRDMAAAVLSSGHSLRPTHLSNPTEPHRA